jgi:hypothetical protein
LSNARVVADDIKVRVNGLLAENAELRFRVRELEVGVREHQAATSRSVSVGGVRGQDAALWALVPEVEDGDDGEA